MHVGIANPRWRGKRSRHSRRMRNPQFFYVYGKRPMAGTSNYTVFFCHKSSHISSKLIVHIREATRISRMTKFQTQFMFTHWLISSRHIHFLFHYNIIVHPFPDDLKCLSYPIHVFVYVIEYLRRIILMSTANYDLNKKISILQTYWSPFSWKSNSFWLRFY